MPQLFWLSDEQWAQLEPHLPKNQPGARRVDDRRVISGIIHVLRTGCRWCDCRGIRAVDNYLQPLPPVVRASFLDGPGGGFGSIRSRDKVNGDRIHLCESPSVSTWGKRGAKSQVIGKSRGGQTTKVYLLTDTLGRPHTLVLTPGNASDMTGADLLLSRMPKTRYLIADKGYDADRLRASLRDRGTVPVIPGRTNQRQKVAYDRKRYRNRHLVENAFCCLKDFRRVATRYDKLAVSFLSAVALAAIIAFWV